MTITVCDACAQKLAGDFVTDPADQHQALHQTVRTPTVDTVWGIKPPGVHFSDEVDEADEADELEPTSGRSAQTLPLHGQGPA